MAKAILAVGVLAIVALTAIAVGQNISGTEDVKIVAKKLAAGSSSRLSRTASAFCRALA